MERIVMVKVFRAGRWIGYAAMVGVLGCASQPVAPRGQRAQEVQAPADPQACSGNLVPPTGYHQETAFVPLSVSNARQQAAEDARMRLRDRLCQGYRCEQIAEHVTVWRTTHDGRQACVMAVASREKVAAVYAEPTRELEAGLARMASTIEGALGEIEGDEGGEANSVALDTINDSGVNGGPRAEWLHDQILAALSYSGVSTRKLPGRWSGLGLPPSTGAVVRGTIRQIPGQEAMLEASFRLERGDEIRGIGSVRFPQAIAPMIDPQTHMPPLPEGNGKVALHMDARPGGALCEGQQTELWLETAEPLHVRVINLYGNGEGGLMVYSSGEERLPPHHPVSLGEFKAVRASEVPVERFLVVAAPTMEALGRFASLETTCRLPATMASALNGGQQVPRASMPWAMGMDYRLMSGEACEDVAAPPAQDLSMLEGLPSCW
ncbi:hypothetical protein EA187_15860 [Lujinxingia sediminis]|uniref:DUF4384 domain-containing protein n=1 Tax=Lujinxingia sediminis TaxID=2480984 RepID=A0ABY0CQ93_9DELT|nr:hypothetical protein [Lujinxingia sediminis]RVU42662.1 hypothetical protein EA187_15860 [Lujinxingia sediminis]